ncbi:hypothetical protein [Robbsia andropogonis]|uniref:hypothetical protein n=1 Tax=Robbsia andropogonis TaxID=28092 RepID=UPI0015884AC7|nr:hypothetical protein [Robbsia andropogonis]
MAFYYYTPYSWSTRWNAGGDKPGDPSAFVNKPLSGGAFDGYDASRLVTNQDASGRRFKFFIFPTNTTGYKSLVILNADGIHCYNVMMPHQQTGTYLTDKALWGAPPDSPSSFYNGKTLNELTALAWRGNGANPVIEINVRQWNATGGQLVIQDAWGFHLFNLDSGGFFEYRNVRLNRGPFDGAYQSELWLYRSTKLDTPTFIRASISSSTYRDLQFMTKDGITAYDFESGNYHSTVNPTLVGGALDNQKVGDLIAKGQLVNQTWQDYVVFSDEPLYDPARIDF